MAYGAAPKGETRAGATLPVMIAVMAGAVLGAEVLTMLLPAMPAVAAMFVRLGLALSAALCVMMLLSRQTGTPMLNTPAVDAPPKTELPVASAEAQEAGWDAIQVAVFAAEKLSYFRMFSDILKQRTNSVISDTEGNAISLMQQLRDVENGMESLLTFITTSNDGVVQIIESTEAQLSHSRSLIDEFSQRRIHDAASVRGAMDDIGKVVGSLGQMVRIVRGIAHQTRMLALNATIEAVRAGDSGKGFAIVASEVKALSQQSDQAAVQIGEGIEKLEKVVQDSLQTIVGERVAKEGSGFAVISDAVTDLTGKLESLIEHQRSILARVQQDNEQLAQPIMQMIGSIQFQDVVKRRLMGLVLAFDHIVESIDGAIRQVSRDPNMSLADMNTLIRESLDDMVNSSLDELRSDQGIDQGTQGGASPQSAAIELF